VAIIAMVELWVPSMAGHLKFLYYAQAKDMTVEGVRVGSVFGDYEMFAEYIAIFIPILLIRIISEKVFLRQIIWVPLMGMAIMLLLGTATRGAFVSLIAGVIYLVWISRRIMNFQKFLPVLIVAMVGFYVSAIALDQYTSSASLFGRLGKTKLVSGMPDTRARVWTEAWGRIMDKPWLGHGPTYVLGTDEKNVRRHYPHSLFLFMSFIVGIPGAILFYVLILIIFFRSLQAARKYATEKSQFAYTVVILSSTLVIFMVDEIKICFLRYPQTQHFTWTLFALVISSTRLANQLSEQREKKRLAANRASD